MGLLFQAKCKDLEVRPQQVGLDRFRDLCEQKCSNRKVVLTEMKLAFNFANQIANIIRNDYICRIAHLNLSRNSLRDTGSVIIATAVGKSQAIVSLNLMHNDISPNGMAQVFAELSSSNTLVTLLIGAEDSFNRNRFSGKACEALCSMLDCNPMVDHLNIASVQLGTKGFKNLFEYYWSYSKAKQNEQIAIKKSLVEDITSLEKQIASTQGTTAKLRVELQHKQDDLKQFKAEKVLKQGLSHLDISNNDI
jgi:hypothetical protein